VSGWWMLCLGLYALSCLCRAGSRFYLLIYACFTQLLFVLVRGVIVVYFMIYVLVFIVRLCGSTLFRHCLLAKNKIK
jgi:hypothetical protein